MERVSRNPNFRKSLTVRTDASSRIPAGLGSWRAPCSICLKKFAEAETGYSKYGQAFFTGAYLEGTKFIVRVDYNPLRFLHSPLDHEAAGPVHQPIAAIPLHG